MIPNILKIDKIVNSVGDAIDKNFTNKEEKEEAKAKLQQLANESVSNARNMQETALKQEDKFSKRFVYYLASFWSFIAGTYLFSVTFFTYPVANTRIVDTITGFLLGTIIASIITFFFGSSQGSKDKDSIMEKLKNKIKNK